MKCSIESVRSVIKLFLELKDTPYCFHQTLTFRGEMADRQAAKNALERLLDVLHKQFEVVSLFTEEGHHRSKIHFHLVFLFYGPQRLAPEPMRKFFGKALFDHWHRITHGSVVRQANRITLWKKQPKLLKYLVKEAHLTKTAKETCRGFWHGKRNKKLIAAQTAPVTNRQIREAMNYCFPNRALSAPMKFYNDWSKCGPQFYDKAKLRQYRNEIEAKGNIWRKHKDALTKIKNCPDRDYMEWLNHKIDLDGNTI